MIVTDLMTGAVVSSLTVRVTVVCLPAESVATIVIVLLPAVSVTVVLNDPSEPTVTDLPFTVSVTGDDVTSFVVPDTVTVVLFVTRPSAGEATESVGGTVLILNVADFAAAAFPSKSDALTVIVCEPSASALPGVYEQV